MTLTKLPPFRNIPVKLTEEAAFTAKGPHLNELANKINEIIDAVSSLGSGWDIFSAIGNNNTVTFSFADLALQIAMFDTVVISNSNVTPLTGEYGITCSSGTWLFLYSLNIVNNTAGPTPAWIEVLSQVDDVDLTVKRHVDFASADDRISESFNDVVVSESEFTYKVKVKSNVTAYPIGLYGQQLQAIKIL